MKNDSKSLSEEDTIEIMRRLKDEVNDVKSKYSLQDQSKNSNNDNLNLSLEFTNKLLKYKENLYPPSNDRSFDKTSIIELNSNNISHDKIDMKFFDNAKEKLIRAKMDIESINSYNFVNSYGKIQEENEVNSKKNQKDSNLGESKYFQSNNGIHINNSAGFNNNTSSDDFKTHYLLYGDRNEHLKPNNSYTIKNNKYLNSKNNFNTNSRSNSRNISPSR